MWQQRRTERVPAAHELHIRLRAPLARLHAALLRLVVEADRYPLGNGVHLRVDRSCRAIAILMSGASQEGARRRGSAPGLCAPAAGVCSPMLNASSRAKPSRSATRKAHAIMIGARFTTTNLALSTYTERRCQSSITYIEGLPRDEARSSRCQGHTSVKHGLT